MKKIYRILIVFITISVLGIGSWSCQWHTIEPVQIVIGEDPVSFSTQIQPIFDKCIGCHSYQTPILTSADSYNNLINGNYVNTSDAASSILLTKITGGDHNGMNFTNEEQTLILTWTQQGAENN